MLRHDFSFSRGALALLPVLSEIGWPIPVEDGAPPADCRWWLSPEATWTESSSKEAEAGTIVHQALAPLVKGGVLALPDKPELRAMYGHARAWLLANRFTTRAGATFPRVTPPERAPLLSLRAEVLFAYDVATRTGREIADPPGLEGTRWYVSPEHRAAHGIKDSEICGRLDLVSQGVDERGGFAQIDDYKFHFGPEGSIALAQLALGALAVSKALGFDRVKVTGVHVWEDRDPYLETYELGAWELDTVAVRLDVLAYPAAANDPTPASGAHCKAMRCPARASCPVGLDAAESLISVNKLVRRPIQGAIQDAEHFEWKMTLKDLLEEIASAIGKELRGFADATPNGVRLSNGTVYSGKSHPRMTPDLTAPGAIAALEKLGLGFALKTSTSWAAIKEVAGEDGELEARALLKKLGAVKEAEVTVHMARKPETAKAPKAAKRAS